MFFSTLLQKNIRTKKLLTRGNKVKSLNGYVSTIIAKDFRDMFVLYTVWRLTTREFSVNQIILGQKVLQTD